MRVTKTFAHWKGDIHKKLREFSSQRRTRLKSYDEACHEVHPMGTRYHLRPEPIAVDRIKGSVNRCQDYNANFQPTWRHRDEHWMRMVRAARDGAIFPPIDVYQLGDEYYVIDGNHRVAVSKLLDTMYIDANVTEMLTDTHRRQERKPH